MDYQNSSDKFLWEVSTDAVSKVWCKLVIQWMCFGVCSGGEKCNDLGQKSHHWKTIGTSQVETPSGPNNSATH